MPRISTSEPMSIATRARDPLRAYLARQKDPLGLIAHPPHPALGIVVVIPCRDEPDVLTTLASLAGCRAPGVAVEVLLVWNASENDHDALRRRHARARARVDAWRRGCERPWLRFHGLDYPRLTRRHAGVGLARKLGMDAAVVRFAEVDNPRGIIASLDADCRVDADYLLALESHFARRPDARACSIYFEHALEGPLAKQLYRGMTFYELFLRYYRHGLDFAGLPFAHYTVGSCFAVRSDAYARQGGMNRRKAGEDFYFLNKLMAVGGVTDLTATRVMPGVRASTRTPFGTGRALRAHLRDRPAIRLAYDPRVFRDLRGLVADAGAYARLAAGAWRVRPGLSAAMNEFLLGAGIVSRHAEMRRNAASEETFRKRFFAWFDGFRALKFVHHATRMHYPRQPLEQACLTLLEWLDVDVGALPDHGALELLAYLRARDRHGPPVSLTGNGCPLDSQAV